MMMTMMMVIAFGLCKRTLNYGRYHITHKEQHTSEVSLIMTWRAHPGAGPRLEQHSLQYFSIL